MPTPVRNSRGFLIGSREVVLYAYMLPYLTFLLWLLGLLADGYLIAQAVVQFLSGHPAWAVASCLAALLLNRLLLVYWRRLVD